MIRIGAFLAEKKEIAPMVRSVLLYALDNGGPRTRERVVEALAHLDGSDLKRRLHRAIGEGIPKELVEETISMIRAREEDKTAKQNKNQLIKKYGNSLVLSTVYGAIENIFSDKNKRHFTFDLKSITALNTLLSFFSSKGWEGEFSKDDRKRIKTDVRNALLHVLRRTKDLGVREAVAKKLATERKARKIIRRIERRERKLAA